MFQILILNLLLCEEIPVTRYEHYTFFELLPILLVYDCADKGITYNEGEGRVLLLVCHFSYYALYIRC